MDLLAIEDLVRAKKTQREPPSRGSRTAARRAALTGGIGETGDLPVAEEPEERRRDRAYWQPLRQGFCPGADLLSCGANVP